MWVKWYKSRSFMYKYLIKLQVPTTIYKSNGLPKKKKATPKRATPSPKKTDGKQKKINKWEFFLFLSHLPTLKIPIGLYAG